MVFSIRPPTDELKMRIDRVLQILKEPGPEPERRRAERIYPTLRW
jgi:hypothetical protein